MNNHKDYDMTLALIRTRKTEGIEKLPQYINPLVPERVQKRYLENIRYEGMYGDKSNLT